MQQVRARGLQSLHDGAWKECPRSTEYLQVASKLSLEDQSELRQVGGHREWWRLTSWRDHELVEGDSSRLLPGRVESLGVWRLELQTFKEPGHLDLDFYVKSLPLLMLAERYKTK